MDHLENKGAAGAHLDLADVEAEPKEGFEERALAIGLATQGHDLWDRQLLPEGHRRRLETVVGLEPRRASRGVGGDVVGVFAGLVGGGLGGRAQGVGGRHWRE